MHASVLWEFRFDVVERDRPLLPPPPQPRHGVSDVGVTLQVYCTGRQPSTAKCVKRIDYTVAARRHLTGDGGAQRGWLSRELALPANLPQHVYKGPGAQGGSRTLMALRPADFESAAYTSTATWACCRCRRVAARRERRHYHGIAGGCEAPFSWRVAARLLRHSSR
jgi:hypothetical protein